MSMLLSIYFLLAEILIVNSAPKLGNISFDPLTLEADNDDDKHEPSIKKNNNYNLSKDPKNETKQESESNSSEDFQENSEDKTESKIAFNNVTIISSQILMRDGSEGSDDRTTTKTTDENNEPSNLLKKLLTPLYNLDKNIELTTAQKNFIKSTKDYRNIHFLRYILRNKRVQDSVQNSGYDYDSQICTLVNGRIQCGYEKNTGTIDSDQQIKTINSDCRIRGNRIECGYSTSSKHSVQALKGNFKNKLTKLSNESKNKPDDHDYTVKASRQGVKSISSLPCTDCRKPSTPESEETIDVPITPDTEVITIQKIDTITKKKEVAAINENKTTSTLPELEESSTSNLDYITPSEVKKETVKTLNKILRKNSEPSDSYEEKTEKPVTRCVEKCDRIVCYNYKIKNATKPSVAK